jgi:fructose-1,6-bisphosphatase/inositol monophosphatase family enzyme
VMVEQCLKLYDVAGTVPIITGAGGFIGGWDGKPIDITFEGEAVAASSQELAMEAVRVLRGG